MFRFLAAAAVAGAFAAAAPAQPVVIEVFPSVGPNVTSPSYPGYGANAAAGVGAGGSATGTAGTPTYYEPVPAGGTVSVTDILATSYPSWRGTANPAAPYDQESGNNLFFGVRVADVEGGTIRLADLSYAITDTLDGSLSSAGSFAGAAYSPSWVGVFYGPDGTEFVTSGPATQRVHELWGVGAGTGYPWSDPGSVPVVSPFAVRATYTLAAPEREELEFTGSGEVFVAPADTGGNTGVVPAPAGLWLGLIAVAGYAAARRKGFART